VPTKKERFFWVRGAVFQKKNKEGQGPLITALIEKNHPS
jgi:hypothetical protein